MTEEAGATLLEFGSKLSPKVCEGWFLDPGLNSILSS